MEFVMPILEGAWRYVLTLRISDYLDIALMAYAIYWLLKLVGTSKVESVGKVILLFLLSFQIFKIEFRIFMAGFFLQNLFIFFNGFFDFSAFGQRIALIVQRFGIAVFGKFAKSLFIVSGLVKRSRFPAAVLKLLRRGLIIAAAISSQPFLIVVEEKSGLRRNRTAKHKSQNQNSPAKEIQLSLIHI